MFKKNWFKVAMILAVLALAFVFMLETTDTMALFSDSGTSSENVFTAGTVDMKMANNGDGYADTVSATWTSPPGWLPGESVSATLNFTNVGTADILELVMDFNVANEVDPDSDGSVLADVIVLSSWEETFDGGTPKDFTSMINDVCSGDADPLLLSELASCSWVWGAPGPVTVDEGGNGTLLAAGNQQDYQLILEFTFMESAGNVYQGDSVEMVVDFMGYPHYEYTPENYQP